MYGSRIQTSRNLDGKSSIGASPRAKPKADVTASEEGGWYVGYATIEVVKEDSLDHFAITVVPDTGSAADTVAYTEGAKIIIGIHPN